MSEKTTAVAKTTTKPHKNAIVAPKGGGTSVLMRLAWRFGVDPAKMQECLMATAFKGGATPHQVMALCIVADQYGLNPWTKEIYAFPDKQNGIVPVVGLDGWARIINEHPQFDGVEFTQDEESCTCTIHRKDRAHPITVTEWLDECKRTTAPWGSHPRRMLRHKALIQCARLAFGFAGIYDQDEAERIAEGVTVSPPAYDLPKKKLAATPEASEPETAPAVDVMPDGAQEEAEEKMPW